MEDVSDLLDNFLQPDGQLCECLQSKTSDVQHICAFGKTLLDLRVISDLCVLNGCAPGERSGRMTGNSAQGSSVMDYHLESAPLARTVHAMAVLDESS